MSMLPIASYTFNGSQTYAQFNNLPQTFSHLQIRMFYTATYSSVNATVIQVSSNGTGPVDNGSNYTTHHYWGNGTATNAQGYASQISVPMSWPLVSGTTYPTMSITDILDYNNTNKYKTIRTIYGVDANGSGEIGVFSGTWMSTNAINCIGIGNAMTFTAGSRIDIYGFTTSSIGTF